MGVWCPYLRFNDGNSFYRLRLTILAMGGAIVMLFLYPLLNTSILRSGNFRPVYAVVFLLFVADKELPGIVGARGDTV